MHRASVVPDEQDGMHLLEAAGAELWWPAELEELAPTYLARVPIDFYDGATLRYDPKRRLIWSIGIDFRDAAGVGERLEEPVFPIPF